MNRCRTSIVTAGVLTVGLLLGSVPPAQAANVTNKNVPSWAALGKIIPGLVDVFPDEYASDTMWLPAKTCGRYQPVPVKGAYFRGLGGFGNSGVTVEVAAFTSVAEAKKAFKAHKRYKRKCTSYKMTAGRKFRVKRLGGVPKVGEQRIGMLRIERGRHLTDRQGRRHVNYLPEVVIRKGKRLAVAMAYRKDAMVPEKRLQKLVKVTARKMR